MQEGGDPEETWPHPKGLRTPVCVSTELLIHPGDFFNPFVPSVAVPVIISVAFLS